MSPISVTEKQLMSFSLIRPSTRTCFPGKRSSSTYKGQDINGTILRIRCDTRVRLETVEYNFHTLIVDGVPPVVGGLPEALYAFQTHHYWWVFVFPEFLVSSVTSAFGNVVL